MSDKAWDIDFTGTSPEKMDQENSTIPNGWYLLALVGAEDDQQYGSKVLTFKIKHGAQAGRTFKEFLRNPSLESEDKKIADAKRKVGVYMKRLGLVDESVAGKVVQKAFSAAISEDRHYIGKYETRKGESKDFRGIANFGYDFYPVGHPSLVADVYPQCGLVAPPHAPKASDAKGGDGKGKRGEPAPAVAPVVTPAAAAAMFWGSDETPGTTPAAAAEATPASK